MKTYLVITTIHIPHIAKAYCANFKKYGHQNDVGIIIIGDRKSPDSESKTVASRLQKQGFDVEYFSIKRQHAWLSKYPRCQKIIPYNSDNRRNIGYLMALEKNCDVLISIDDDCFPLPEEDFFAHHHIVGTSKKQSVIKTSTHWFNICELLEKKPDQKIYPRGFPYTKRWKSEKITRVKKEVTIGANAGLWLHDPDIDSITRIHRDIQIMKFSGKPAILDKNCYSPINTQNTAIRGDLIPAYYFVLMGQKVDDLVIDRYGDIWSGLFLKKVLDALNLHVNFGKPITNHLRNKHNLYVDLKQELGCIRYTDYLADVLEGIKLEGKDVVDAYANLANQLLKIIVKDKTVSQDFKKYFRHLHYCQMIWLDTAQKVLKSR